MNHDPSLDPPTSPESSLNEETVLLRLLTWDHPDWTQLKKLKSFSGKWVIHFLNRDRPVPEDAIKQISVDRAFRSEYAIRLAIVKNPSTPLAIGLNFLPGIRWGDLLAILRMPRISPQIKQRIREHFGEIIVGMTLGEKISLARRAPRFLIRLMRVQGEPRVISALLQNPYFTYEDALFLANYPRVESDILKVLARSAKWVHHKEIRRSLVRHARTPRNLVPSLLQGFNLFDMKILVQDRCLPIHVRHMVRRRLAELEAQRRGHPPGGTRG